MDVKKIGNIEYNYILEIDNIKRALYLSILLHLKIKKQEDIKLSDRRIISRYAKEFKVLCKKLINREGINSYSDYKNCIQALVLINAKIQAILNDKKYNRNKFVEDIEKEYNKINRYLPYAQSSAMVFVENHLTCILFFILVGLMVCWLAISTFVVDFFAVVVALITLLVLTVIFTIFYKRIYKNFYIDQINRTINKNTYVRARKIDAYHKGIKKIFNLYKNKY